MAVHSDMRALMRRLLVVFGMLLAAPSWSADVDSAKEQAERQRTQPFNNAPVWRDVRSGDSNPYQTTQVRGIETNILIQSEGDVWRQIRNGPVTIYGGWLVLGVVLAIGLFYWRKGEIKLRGKPTGRKIERFTPWERIVHWTTAVSFVILAASGLMILFGKHVVLPVFGYTLFSWLAILSKYLHNFVGPLFVICTVLMFVTFVRHNLPKLHDLNWFSKAGGLLSGEHVPSGKFNAGEKSWFWLGVIALGIAVSTTGLVLDFPNLVQSRNLMQQANVIHAIAAVLFISMGLGHIYLGTIGMEGAYDSMRDGYVDEAWAKEHHQYWYEEVMKNRDGAAGGAPSAAHASAMKEGWKL